MTVDDCITQIWRTLDKIPFPDEISKGMVDIDSSMLDSPSKSFSKENLRERIEDAQRDVSKKVKASHQPSLVASSSTASYNGTNLVASDLVRPLLSRVFNDSVRCRRRSVNRHRRLSSSGRDASATYPIVTYEDRNMIVYPYDGTDTVKYYYIKEPTALTTNGQSLQLPDRFKHAVIMYVCSTCFQTLRLEGLQDYCNQIYMDELFPYLRETQTSQVRSLEVDIE